MNRFISVFLISIIIAGCAVAYRSELDEMYGKEQVRNRIVAESKGPDYHTQVKPILDRRCAVCHACYDAPCQLKLTSSEGIDRGASKLNVYNSERLFSVSPTRLFYDAKNTNEWRNKGFYSVISEREQNTKANLDGSLLYKMLELKKFYPGEGSKILPKSYDFDLYRDQQCPRIEEFPRYATAYPLWGMPYGLPKLSDAEYEVLRKWIESGAEIREVGNVESEFETKVRKWESFLNGKSNKQRLMSRYIYEHLFIAGLYFSEINNKKTYRIVRSTTPPGQPINIISSRRPYDDPGVSEFFYRLWPEKSTLSSKTNMPYALNSKRMTRWNSLFLKENYQVLSLPSYNPISSSNPFKTFSDIPVSSRYKFLLDEAEYTIMTFIKGPVCRGRIALSVIEDRFWVAFVNPDLDQMKLEDEFLKEQQDNLRLPSERASDVSVASIWTTYSSLEKKYLKAKETKLKRLIPTNKPVGLKTIWDGNKIDTNAALTVFRHGDAATVVRGWVGKTPKTAWLIGYTLLERIYYLLVAGYDVFGNVGHQLNSRLFMDFLRMEGEYNFLSLLPYQARVKERDYWYRDAPERVLNYLTWGDQNLNLAKGFSFRTNNYKSELLTAMKRHYGAALTKSNNIEDRKDLISKKLSTLMGKRGRWVKLLPEIAFLRVRSRQGNTAYTIVHDLGYSNVATPFFENDRRMPEEDELTILNDIIGSYPNAFYDVREDQLDNFMTQLTKMRSENGYSRFVDLYGVRRTDSNFWNFADWLHDELGKTNSHHMGILDFNRLENR